MQVTIVNSCPNSIQVIYWGGDGQQVNAFLENIARDCFLASLNNGDLKKLTQRGEVKTYSEQFGWLPVNAFYTWGNRPKYLGVPIHAISSVEDFASAIGNGGAS